MFRLASSRQPNNEQYRFAHIVALRNLGRIEQAEHGLNELLARDPSDAEFNLAMARLLSSQNRPDWDWFYHRAIYGTWDANAAERRKEVRFEFAERLAQTGANRELLAELLLLQGVDKDDLSTQKRIASLYLQAGSASRAAEIYRSVLRKEPRDSDALFGLGEAALAEGRYRTALNYFRSAGRRGADQEKLEQRIQMTSEVLELDPTLRSLRLATRLRRTRDLLARTVTIFTSCRPDDKPPDLQSANEALQAKPRRTAEIEEAIETNLSLGESLWEAALEACEERVATRHPAVAHVMARLEQ
jgi:tetratricopeptide (TPR) repeat protein